MLEFDGGQYLGVGLSFGAGPAEPLGRPEPEPLVATREACPALVVPGCSMSTGKPDRQEATPRPARAFAGDRGGWAGPTDSVQQRHAQHEQRAEQQKTTLQTLFASQTGVGDRDLLYP